MKRSGPPKRRTPLTAKTPMKRSSPSDTRRRPSKRRNDVSGPTAAVRQSVMLRDRSCRAWPLGFATDVRCSGGAHVHHVVLRSQGGTHDADNLMLLCDLHHRIAHDHRRAEAEACGIIKRKEATS